MGDQQPVELAWQEHGDGVPVVMLPPAATPGEVWRTYQVPALVRAGFKVMTVNHRGTAPSPVPPGPYLMSQLVADVVALVQLLNCGPVHLIGASLGAFVAQEVALTRPDLVRAAVLMGTRARTDKFRRLLARALAAQTRSTSPASELESLMHLVQLFGPGTLTDEQKMSDWLELQRRFPTKGAGPAAQYDASVIGDRRAALAGLTRPCLVMAFSADLITPPAAGLEVHQAIPSATYVEFPGLGHFGFLEEPDAVNQAIIDFLVKSSGESHGP
ncbi:MAG: alpha/beta hydrolase [Hamadaea sp.]|nr:alpha/beta hydrolase [Hamadaea sp.]NUR50407.1 alpha/beta hydrolase [Hamadaea sp.]NUT03679.1 alpha/beta hydrolase [Hamadaea sp.]